MAMPASRVEKFRRVSRLPLDFQFDVVTILSLIRSPLTADPVDQIAIDQATAM